MSEPSNTQIRDAIILVMAALSQNVPGRPILSKAVVEGVCEHLGVTEDCMGSAPVQSGGKAKPKFPREISRVFNRNIRNDGLGEQIQRGTWSLTPAGITEAARLRGEEPEEATEAEAEKTTTTVNEGVPFTFHLDGPEASEYCPDPEIVALAIEQTPCFIEWSPRANECKDCPLRVRCRAAQATVMEAIAGDLASRDQQLWHERQRREAARRRASARNQVPSQEAIDDVLSSIESTAAPLEQRLKALGFNVVASIPAEAVCVGCDSRCPKNSWVAIKRGVGSRCRKCAEALVAEGTA